MNPNRRNELVSRLTTTTLAGLGLAMLAHSGSLPTIELPKFTTHHQAPPEFTAPQKPLVTAGGDYAVGATKVMFFPHAPAGYKTEQPSTTKTFTATTMRLGKDCVAQADGAIAAVPGGLRYHRKPFDTAKGSTCETGKLIPMPKADSLEVIADNNIIFDRKEELLTALHNMQMQNTTDVHDRLPRADVARTLGTPTEMYATGMYHQGPHDPELQHSKHEPDYGDTCEAVGEILLEGAVEFPAGSANVVPTYVVNSRADPTNPHVCPEGTIVLAAR